LKAGGAYLAGAWLLVQLADTVLPVLGAPDWVLRVFLFVLAIGLPLMLAFAWAFEITPEGIRRTEEVDPAASQTKETGRKIQYLIVGLLGLTVVVLAADRLVGGEPARSASSTRASGAAGVPRATLPDGTEAVAVMPFTTSGPETDVWKEGMVSMLTTNLDGMGGLRAIDKRTVLARWRERVPEGGAADLATTLNAARAAQASVAVVGDVVSIGETMRISAAVHDTESGATLGRLQAEGNAGDFMALIDQITVQAVEAARRDGEAGGDALPVPDVSALTTESLPALRAYLDGERLYRQSRFEQAIEPLERAVALDSTFAMAHLRLADTYASTLPTAINDIVTALAAVRKHLRAADRHGGRLPRRERALLEASTAIDLEGDRPKSADILRAAVQRFPTDPELWARYSDILASPIVARHVGTEPIGGMRQAARRALALDSTMTPAYIPMITPAIGEGDTTTARRLMAAYDRHAGRGRASRTMDSFEAALDLAYGDSAQQAAVLQDVRAGTLRDGVILYALYFDPNAATLRAQEQFGRVLSEQRGLYSGQVQAWFYGGQYDTLRAFIQDTTRTSQSARTGRLWGATVLVERGALPAAAVPDRLIANACQLADEGYYRLVDCYYTGRLSVFRRQAGVPGEHAARIQTARSVLDASIAEFEAADEPELARSARGYRGLLDGQAALAAGDPAAHDTLDAAYRHLAFIAYNFGEWAPMEAQIRALIGSSQPGRALEYATIVATRDPYGHYLAGRAHEAAGNPEPAREAYAQFVSAWARADADIPALQYARAVLDAEAPAEAPPL